MKKSTEVIIIWTSIVNSLFLGAFVLMAILVTLSIESRETAKTPYPDEPLWVINERKFNDFRASESNIYEFKLRTKCQDLGGIPVKTNVRFGTFMGSNFERCELDPDRIQVIRSGL